MLGGVDPVAAAGLPNGTDPATAASLFPRLDTTRHVVMEIQEPDYAAILAQYHETHEAWMKTRQPQVQAELDAKKKRPGNGPAGAASASDDGTAATAAASASFGIDTTPTDGDTITGNATLAGPLVPPRDAQALAEAMAASAGEGASTSAADYLAAASSLIDSYSQIGTTPAPVTPATAAVAVDPSPAESGGRRLQQAGTTHDLLVVYTQAAASAAGGVAAIENSIRQAVAGTNTMYTNSRVSLSLRLVGIRMVSGVPGDGSGLR